MFQSFVVTAKRGRQANSIWPFIRPQVYLIVVSAFALLWAWGRVWFGVSDAAPVFLIFLASLFPIAVSATAAVQNIQTVYVRAAQNFGLSRWQMFRRVILPATLPQMLTSLRITLGIAWLVVVAAEMIGAQYGIGAFVLAAGNLMQTDQLLAGVVMLSILGLLIAWGLGRLERSLLRWR